MLTVVLSIKDVRSQRGGGLSIVDILRTRGFFRCGHLHFSQWRSKGGASGGTGLGGARARFLQPFKNAF